MSEKDPWQSLKAVVRQDLYGPIYNSKEWGWFEKNRQFIAWCEKRLQANAGSLSSRQCRRLFPEWWFDVRENRSQRNTLLCLYAAMKQDNVWQYVQALDWVGMGRSIRFRASPGGRDLKTRLMKHGFGDWWLASLRGEEGWQWGLRSRFRGCQLHFRGMNNASAEVEAHLDLHNPGDPLPRSDDTSSWLAEVGLAADHYRKDRHNRDVTHSWIEVSQALRNQGTDVARVK